MYVCGLFLQTEWCKDSRLSACCSNLRPGYKNLFNGNALTSLTLSLHVTENKCSAVAEMGDRLPTWTWTENWGLCPFSRKLDPHVTQYGLDRGLYLCTKWHLDPTSRLATVNMDHKFARGCASFSEEGSWVPISYNVAWAEAYLHTMCHLDPSSSFATVDMSRKLGGGSAPLFLEGELGPHLTQCGQGPGSGVARGGFGGSNPPH